MEIIFICNSENQGRIPISWTLDGLFPLFSRLAFVLASLIGKLEIVVF